MKSCSTIKAVFLEFKMNLLMTLAVIILYSESKYALGSSNRYTFAGFPKAKINATLYNSPPVILYKIYKNLKLIKLIINLKDFRLLNR